jgi:hypothetical protein
MSQELLNIENLISGVRQSTTDGKLPTNLKIPKIPVRKKGKTPSISDVREAVSSGNISPEEAYNLNPKALRVKNSKIPKEDRSPKPYRRVNQNSRTNPNPGPNPGPGSGSGTNSNYKTGPNSGAGSNSKTGSGSGNNSNSNSGSGSGPKDNPNSGPKPKTDKQEGATPSVQDVNDAMARGDISPEQAYDLNPDAGFTPSKQDVHKGTMAGSWSGGEHYVSGEQAKYLLGRDKESKERKSKESQSSQNETPTSNPNTAPTSNPNAAPKAGPGNTSTSPATAPTNYTRPIITPTALPGTNIDMPQSKASPLSIANAPSARGSSFKGSKGVIDGNKRISWNDMQNGTYAGRPQRSNTITDQSPSGLAQTDPSYRERLLADLKGEEAQNIRDIGGKAQAENPFASWDQANLPRQFRQNG